MTLSHPPPKAPARRLTLLLNLSANQVAAIERATAGPLEPHGPEWREFNRLIERGMLKAGRCAWDDMTVTLKITPFGKAAVAAYRAADEAGLLRAVA